uniref:Copper transport protein n=1 Tax=Kalanchoe fedtschenkoi TaxID=63787 RepID=A0A7N0U3M4_KALFE
MEMDHGHQAMDGMGGAGSMSKPADSTMTHKTMMHMTFFWGSRAEILFPGWPGANAGMYALSLFVICATAFLVEWISHSNFIKQGAGNKAAGILQTLLHGLRMGLAYLVMLAVMSFNAGVFLAAVAGHVAGFFVFGSRFFKQYYPEGKSIDLPPMSC